MKNDIMVKMRTAFAKEIRAACGSVNDAYQSNNLLVLRGVLPLESRLRPRDRIKGGVALRSDPQNVWIHPYVFRLVCQNGAIFAQSAESTRLCLEELDEDEVPDLVRQATRACCSNDAFASAAQLMARAKTWKPDQLLAIIDTLARSRGVFGPVADQFVQRYIAGRDATAYGMMNAITSVARDTRDPEKRWRLEELGGAVPSIITDPPPPEGAAASPKKEFAMSR